MGKAICMLDPPTSKTVPRKIYIGGGWKSARDTSPRTPLRTPPPVRENNWVYVIIQFVDNLSEHQKYIKLFYI